MFKVGQKVVCIKEFEGVYEGFPELSMRNKLPVKGCIYTILEICADGYLALVGFSYSGIYDPNKFRPLDYDFVEEVIEQVKPKTHEKSKCI